MEKKVKIKNSINEDKTDICQINKTENSLLADLTYKKYVYHANSQQKKTGEAILILK